MVWRVCVVLRGIPGRCAAWLRWGRSAPHTCHARYLVMSPALTGRGCGVASGATKLVPATLSGLAKHREAMPLSKWGKVLHVLDPPFVRFLLSCAPLFLIPHLIRSEERRVGKECRSRRSRCES